jgi:hypothetical protein
MTTNESKTIEPMLTAAFAERPSSVLDPERREARRREAILRIESVLKEVHPVAERRWRQSYWLAAAGAVALAAGLALVVGRAQPKLAASRFFQQSGIVECQAMNDEQWSACRSSDLSNVVGVKTQVGAEATLDTPDGVRIALESTSVVGIANPTTSRYDHRVTLAKGRIHLLVPKLGAGQFAVVTPTATVTVHGTAFSVEVAPTESSSRTCVRLHEGVISVDSSGRSERLVAPATWGCSEPAPGAITKASGSPTSRAAERESSPNDVSNGSASNPSSRASNASAADASSESVPTGRRAPSKPNAAGNEHSSSLEQEIVLLQRALGAEQRREFTLARQGFKQLLTQYPNSVMAPEAKAALQRLNQAQPKER